MARRAAMTEDQVRQYLLQQGIAPERIDAAITKVKAKQSIQGKTISFLRGVAENKMLPYVGGTLAGIGGGMLGAPAGPAGVGTFGGIGYLSGKTATTAAQEGLKNVVNAWDKYANTGNTPLETITNPLPTIGQNVTEGVALGELANLLGSAYQIVNSGKNITNLMKKTPGGPSQKLTEEQLGKFNLKKIDLTTGQPKVDVNPALYAGGTRSAADVSGIEPLAQKEVGAVLNRYPIPGTVQVSPPTTEQKLPTWNEIHELQLNAARKAKFYKGQQNTDLEKYWSNMQKAYSNIIKQGVPLAEQLYKQYETGQKINAAKWKLAAIGGAGLAYQGAHSLWTGLMQSIGNNK